MKLGHGEVKGSNSASAMHSRSVELSAKRIKVSEISESEEPSSESMDLQLPEEEPTAEEKVVLINTTILPSI